MISLHWPKRTTFATVLCAGLLTACSGSEPEASRVFVAAPWTGDETLTYRVTDRGVEGEGQCTLTTREAEPQGFELARTCTKAEFGDSGKAIVDERLDPRSSERILTDAKKGKRVAHTVVYDTLTSHFTTDDGDEVRETDRTLPKATNSGPQPAWYDDESILWMVRGVELRDGYSAAYHHVINAGQPRILVVELAVSGRERVTVPAGSFDAWVIRVQRSNSSYIFWVDAGAAHVVLRARIEDVTYELVTQE